MFARTKYDLFAEDILKMGSKMKLSIPFKLGFSFKSHGALIQFLFKISERIKNNNCH